MAIGYRLLGKLSRFFTADLVAGLITSQIDDPYLILRENHVLGAAVNNLTTPLRIPTW